MLVFGEGRHRERSRDKLDRIRAHLTAADAAGPGIVRHGLLAAALIEAGELAQGVIDSGFAARGRQDARHPPDETVMALATGLARLLARSWRSGLACPENAVALLDGFGLPPLPDEIEVALPEGFAFYAVYPESYLAGAERLRGLGPVLTVGLRSIGTTLAAIVAGALDAPSPLTVRPVGHPFDRHLSLAPALAAELASAPSSLIAVVDEGPGLSGSSFAAAIRTLEDLGVASERIHLLPSHPGEPGPEAGGPTRAAWSRVRRHVATFDDVVLGADAPEQRLGSWFADLVGEALAPLEEISGGAWRALEGSPEPGWPPAQPSFERRKFMLRAASGPWLLKFAGLGGIGLGKLDRARALAEAGFSPPPAGWRHGFLAEPWLAAPRLTLAGSTRLGRAALVARVGAYLGFRSRAFTAPDRAGASLETLAVMARHNLREGLGEDVAQRFEPLLSSATGLQRLVRPIETDGRLHAWEWLDSPGGLLKTDALDHHAGHDLVGCQDVAWDIAGAIVEFDLSGTEADALAAVVEGASGRPVHTALISFLRPCYLAFQLGSWTMSAAAASSLERDPIDTLLARYRGQLVEGCETGRRQALSRLHHLL